MAGKKQHFIPQHFLKAFAIPGSNNQIWMYRRGTTNGIKVALKDAATQHYFYSKPTVDGRPSLDDLMTEYERKFQKTVSELRNLDAGEKIDSEKISEVVAHLSVRSSYLREVLNEIAFSATGTFRKHMPDELTDMFKKLPRNHPPEKLYGLICKELRKRNFFEVTQVSESTLVNCAYFNFRENSGLFLSEYQKTLDVMLNQFTKAAKQTIENEHKSVLKESFAPDARVSQLSQLEWRLTELEGAGVILPDCTSIAFDGEEWNPSIFVDANNLQVVLLPITPNKIAVGKISNETNLDLSRFNFHASRCSHAFFLSNYESQDLVKLLDDIGRDEKLSVSIENESKNALSDSIEELFCAETKAEIPTERESIKCKAEIKGVSCNKQKYSISFLDFGDQGLLTDVANSIGMLLEFASGSFPVESVSGFTFANDYKSALNRVRHSIDSMKDFEPIETQNYSDMGIPITTVSNGEISTHLVFRSSVAKNLICEIKERQEDAKLTICNFLAIASLTKLLANKFPQQMLKPIQDTYEESLYAFTSRVFNAFYSSSVSNLNERQLNNYEDLALSTLQRSVEEIPNMRRAYRNHGNIETFYSQSADLISNVLVFFATIFGTYSAINRELSANSKLVKLLEEHELCNWAKLFNKDLNEFKSEITNWTDFEEIFFVNRHFERLMAQHGLFLERTDDERVYVNVPYYTDFHHLLNSVQN